MRVEIQLVRNILALALALSLSSVAWTAQEGQTKTKGKNSVTVTGCLQKGDEPNEYSITDTSGNIYGLRSSSVKLGDHLGHKVTVTGNMKAESEEKGEKEEHEKKGANTKEVGDIQVTNLTMVSTSCQ